MRDQRGVTLVELLITMAIFVMVMAAIGSIFSGLMTQFKQQARTAETSIEGVVGLEMLREDLMQTGYGIPFDVNGANYNEATGVAAAYNDAPGNDPRAIVTDNNAGFNQSDILVIKATSIALNDAARRWTYITNRGNLPNIVRNWGSTAGSDEFVRPRDDSHHYIFIDPVIQGGAGRRILIRSAGGAFSTQLGDNGFSFNGGGAGFAFEPQALTNHTYIAYGIKTDNPAGAPRMPFNRADYFISRSGQWTTVAVARCSEAAGVLYKSVISHADGTRGPWLPIVDCVADMQLVFILDTDGKTPKVISIDPAPHIGYSVAYDLEYQARLERCRRQFQWPDFVSVVGPQAATDDHLWAKTITLEEARKTPGKLFLLRFNAKNRVGHDEHDLVERSLLPVAHASDRSYGQKLGMLAPVRVFREPSEEDMELTLEPPLNGPCVVKFPRGRGGHGHRRRCAEGGAAAHDP